MKRLTNAREYLHNQVVKNAIKTVRLEIAARHNYVRMYSPLSKVENERIETEILELEEVLKDLKGKLNDQTTLRYIK